MEVTLTPELERLVHEKVSSGHYDSASEVIGEALRLLQERDEQRGRQREELRQEIARGVVSAETTELVPAQEVFDRIRKRNSEVSHQER